MGNLWSSSKNSSRRSSSPNPTQNPKQHQYPKSKPDRPSSSLISWFSISWFKSTIKDKEGNKSDINHSILNGGSANDMKSGEWLYFDDGVRRIDYVIVSRNPTTISKGIFSLLPSEAKLHLWRNRFIEGIVKHGLQVEETKGHDGKCLDHYFIKVHVPWETLAHFAEVLNIRKPLAPEELFKSRENTRKRESHLVESSVAAFTSWMFSDDKKALTQSSSEGTRVDLDINEKVITSPFSCARQDQFLIQNRETFFSPTQRNMIAHYILHRTVFDEGNKQKHLKFGIDGLIDRGAVSAAYCLHSREVADVFDVKKQMFETWQYFFNWKRKRHQVHQVDNIKEYFGEQIGFFFCWMSFLTNMLLPLAVIGLFVMLYGLSTLGTNDYIQDVCDNARNGNITMCPVECLRCGPTHQLCLSDYLILSYSYCTIAKFSHIFNNNVSVFKAIANTTWAFVFMKLFTRRSSVLQSAWNVRDYKSEEVLRPQLYTLNKGMVKPHPITDALEPYICPKTKYRRRVCSLSLIVLLILFASVFIHITKLFKFDCSLPYHKDIPHFASLMNIIITSFINVLFVVIFTKMFTWLSARLTNYEIHRTESEWETSFRIKYFAFSFVTNNAGPLYLLFYQGVYTKTTDSSFGGYTLEMNVLLILLMVGRHIILHALDVATSTIHYYLRNRRRPPKRIHSTTTHKGEADFLLEDYPRHVLTRYYTLLMIQYGFITLYGAVFPLAAIVAVVKNILIMSYLSKKYSTEWRRPVAERAQDIGVYNSIVRFISYFAVVVNACNIAMHTPFIFSFAQSLSGNSNETLVQFRLLEHDGYGTVFSGGTPFTEPCYIHFGHFARVHGYFSTNFFWYIIGALLFVATFTLGMATLAMLIDFLPNIPKAELNDVTKENYLAQKVLQEALIEGYVNRAKISNNKRGRPGQTETTSSLLNLQGRSSTSSIGSMSSQGSSAGSSKSLFSTTVDRMMHKNSSKMQHTKVTFSNITVLATEAAKEKNASELGRRNSGQSVKSSQTVKTSKTSKSAHTTVKNRRSASLSSSDSDITYIPAVAVDSLVGGNAMSQQVKNGRRVSVFQSKPSSSMSLAKAKK